MPLKLEGKLFYVQSKYYSSENRVEVFSDMYKKISDYLTISQESPGGSVSTKWHKPTKKIRFKEFNTKLRKGCF